MKLYNLYKEIILEASNQEDSQRAIEEHLTANITYDGVKRYCRILNIGTIKGKPAIRIFQISNVRVKKDKHGREQRWKTFYIDKIENIELTNFKVNKPITSKDADIPWNPAGDITLGLGSGAPGLSKFGDKKIEPTPRTQPKAGERYASNRYQRPIPSDPVEPKPSNGDKYQTSFKSGVEEPTSAPISNKVPSGINQDPEGNVFDKEPEKYETKQDIGNKLMGYWDKIKGAGESAYNWFKGDDEKGEDNNQEEEEYKIE